MPDLYLGLISGTSADGIDAALVRFDGDRARLVFGRTYPWDPALRAQLVALGQQGASLSLDAIAQLDVRVARAFAEAANLALADSGTAAADVRAIGSHGQTLRHRPWGPYPYSLQVGDPSTIAERTGITTVADLRRRDVAAGGHGAPLLPGLHAALLRAPDEDRAVLNLGGIANLTLLPARGDAGSGPGPAVRGFDTGPANALMDAWSLRHLGQDFDRDGAFAGRGRVDAALLERLLDDPWFTQPPPKSTGRDHFHLGWVEARLRGGESPADVQATLTALTAATVAGALQATQPGTRRVITCGGGVHNPVLMAALAGALPGVAVESTADHGIDPDHVEAMGFAWLARQTLLDLPGNLPSVTGAGGPRVLGGIYPA